MSCRSHSRNDAATAADTMVVCTCPDETFVVALSKSIVPNTSRPHSGNGLEASVPGLSNTWTMPVEKSPGHGADGHQDALGMKFRAEPGGIKKLPRNCSCSDKPSGREIYLRGKGFAGFYINIEVNRAEAARYGLRRDVSRPSLRNWRRNGDRKYRSRERYPVNVRYNATFETMLRT